MLQRYGRREGLISLVWPALFYLSIAFVLIALLLPHIAEIKGEAIIVVGAFAMWRYGWQLINYVRAFIYGHYYYPKLKAQVAQLSEQDKFPEHIFFVIPSYKEEAWVSIETFQSILSNLSDVPCTATLIVATGSDEDDAIIAQTFQAHPAHTKVELVFQRQSEGKRIAMGHALRAVARRYNEEPNSVTIFMDGDSYLEAETLRNTLPFFSCFNDLGALTTNELAYINTKSKWYKDWFNLKFGQRHVLFQSHALSNKVLTLTGRFSMFRTKAICTEEFIGKMENDVVSHWAHGTFRFLMGDDKTSWFMLLKDGWNMLYLPDVLVYSLESRDASFLNLSVNLPFRWYGNTLRNNNRTLQLGWKRIGVFIWFAVLDQRLSMWTSLVGLVGAICLAISKSIFYLPFYLAWVLIVRTTQMMVIAYRGHPVSLLTIPLMLYNQWVGAFIKIKAYYHLGEQSWSKGSEVQKADHNRVMIKHWFAPYLPTFLYLLSFTVFFAFMAYAYKLISLPQAWALTAQVPSNVLQASDFGVTANDHRDDTDALQNAILQLQEGQTLVLPSGTINLAKPLLITQSNITISGNNSQLVAEFSADEKERSVINIVGGGQLNSLKSIKNLARLSFNSESVGRLKVGQSLLFTMENDAQFLHQINSIKWAKKYPKLRRQINRIESVEGNTVTLAYPLDEVLLDRSKIQIYPLDMVSNTHISGVTVRYKVPQQDVTDVAFKYENVHNNHLVNLVSLKWTDRITMENINLFDAGNHPLKIDDSLACVVDNARIKNAWNKGVGGRAYVRLARSHHCQLSSLTVSGIRHIVFQWGASYNQISNLNTAVDINFHGGYSHHNRVSKVYFTLPKQHPWPAVYRTPNDAHWAPPDGPGNEVDQ